MSDFEEIYLRYFSKVYLYILKLCGNEHIAEDVTSETFFKAMKGVGAFKGNCDVGVWLCQIAKNTYFSYLRKNKNVVTDDEVAQGIASDRSVEEKVIESDEADRIRAVLHELPDQYKEVFMWRVFAELDFPQIGGMFGKSENWACVTYYRARKMIKEKLDEQNKK